MFDTRRVFTLSDPAAAAADARASAERVVRGAIAAREDMDRAGRRDAPLVLLAGEVHDRPANIAQHMFILDGLLRHEKNVGVALERPYNDLERRLRTWAHEAARALDMDLTEEGASFARDVQLADKDGMLALKAAFAGFATPFAYHANATFTRFLMQRELPVRFVDIAREGKNKTDLTDPAAQVAIEACLGPQPNATIIAARNMHMAALGGWFAHRRGLRILFHQCGNGHIVNSADIPGVKVSMHLPAQYRAEGYTLRASITQMPKNSAREIAELWLRGEAIPGVAAGHLSANYLPPGREPVSDPLLLSYFKRAAMKTPEQEAGYMAALLREGGLPSAIMTLDDQARDEAACSREITNICAAGVFLATTGRAGGLAAGLRP